MIRIILIAVAIYVAAKLSEHLVVAPSNASPVWPGAGIALAVTLLYGHRALIGVFLGMVAFEFQLFSATEGGGSLVLSIGLASGAALQAHVGALLISRQGGDIPRLVEDRDILRFQLLGGPLACVTSATIGMLVLRLADIVTTANIPVNWLIWWVGDTIGVVIFAPLLLILFGRQDPLLHGRKMSVVGPMLVLLAATFAFFSYSSAKENEEKRLKFNEQVHVYHDSIRRVFHRYLEILDSLKRYYDASEEVTREEFRTFNLDVVRQYTGIQALEWIPRVRHAQRAEFESELPGNQVIRRLDERGVPREAEPLPEYYAIQFIEPSIDNNAAFGYDITSNPVAASALFRARDVGKVAATAALKLVQEKGSDVGIVFYNPVYETAMPPATLEQRRETFRGVVAAVFRIQALIRAEVPVIGKETIIVRMLDISDRGAPELLYTSHPDGPRNQLIDLAETRPLDIAGLHWVLEYTATPQFIAATTSWEVWVVLTGGLLVTAMMGTGLLMLTGRSLRMEGEVAARTAQLRTEIKQRREAEKAVQEREDQLRSILDNVDAYIYMKDLQGCYLFANRAVRNLWHADMDQIIGQSDEKFFDASTAKIIRETDRRVLDDGETIHIEETNTLPSGKGTSVYQSTKLPLRHENGDIYALCGISVDITRQKEHQKQLEYIAHYDALTHLPNRVLLSDRLQLAIAQAHRNRHTLAVVYLDLDGFKPINDSYGHQIGDELLQVVSVRMKESLREGDTIARLGGDEFVAVLIDFPVGHEGDKLLYRLLEAVSEPVSVNELVFRISASLGVTLFPQAEEQDADQLLRQADQAMYTAKLAGKNRFHYFDSKLDSDTRGRHQSLEQIRRALEEQQFVLYYQPKVNLRSGEVIGVEALVRWQHPERGLLPPAEFLPVIEGHMLGVDLGDWVIDTALLQVNDWQAQGLNLPVSVNISSIQLAQPDFVVRLQARLEAYPDVRNGSLKLEILETSALEDIDEVSNIMRACRAIGVDFALDDFGTGYSSLTYLKRLPVSHLKIDRSFVRDMLDDPDDLSILEGVLGLASAFDLPCIAEGVETEAHGIRLLQIGCELAQGYVIARPMPASQIPNWVDGWRPPLAWTNA